jgi:hypothetical protein
MKEKGKSIAKFFLKHTWFEDLLLALPLATLICLITCCSLSPLYPLNNVDYMNGDSNLFRYYAWLWLQGRTPYVDFYDHKGLYHLGVDALGLLIGGGSRYGIFALEILASTSNLYFLARMIRVLKGDERAGRVFAYLMYAALFVILGQGNSEGEWILPFTTLFFYGYIRGVQRQQNRDFVFGSFFMGLSVGLALNSRPLDALWGAMGALYYVIRHIRYHENGWWLLENINVAILGCLIPFAVFYPLAYRGGYLGEMFSAMFLVSNHYWKRHWLEVNVHYILNRLAALGGLSYAFACRHFRKKSARPITEMENFFFLMEVGASFLYLLVLGFFHYFQSGFTFFISGVVFSFDLWPKREGRKFSWRKMAEPILILMCSVYSCLYVIGYYTIGLADFSYRKSSEIAAALQEAIPSSAWEKGEVFAIDCDPAIYLDGSTIVQERFCSYTSGWSKDNPAVKPEIRAYLVSEKHPQYLIFQAQADSVESDYGDILVAHYNVTVATNAYFIILSYVS